MFWVSRTIVQWRDRSAAPGQQNSIQDNKIRYYGQIIALVVADSFEQARDAAARVKVDYNEEYPVTSWEAGRTYAFPPAAVDGQKPTVAILADGVSSIDDVIQGAEVVLDATYTEPIYHHQPSRRPQLPAVRSPLQVSVQQSRKPPNRLKRS